MAFRRVLIAIDESPLAAHAAEVGMDLARAVGADTALVHVVDERLAIPPEGLSAAALLGELRREGQALLAGAVARAGGGPPPWQFLREGKPAPEIVAAAREWGADLIVLASRSRSALARVVLGSTAEWVVRHAPCPVLVVRGVEGSGAVVPAG